MTSLKENDRENSREFLIVLTNEEFGNLSIVKDEISEFFNSMKVKLFVIGPGTTIHINGLLSLVRDAYHVFLCLDKNDTTILNVMQSELSYNYCTKKN